MNKREKLVSHQFLALGLESHPRSLLVHEMSAAVLLPASFVALGAERSLFAIADSVDSARADASGGQCIFHGIGAPVAQGKVVLY